VAEVDHRTKLLEGSQRQLVEARASQSSALTASLISRLDAPTTGPRPVGPGRSMLLLAGLCGGPIFGLAILLISLPSAANLATRRVEPAARPAKHGLSLKQAPLGAVS
jgi:succinoglycan biosynthesis transport protein ExoP